MDTESTQIEMRLAPRLRYKPEDVEMLIFLLEGKGWMPASSVASFAADDFGCTWGERVVRALAAASDGRVISGQLGYRLTTEATIAEVQHAADWLRHQAKEMTRRAVEIDRVYHAKQKEPHA